MDAWVLHCFKPLQQVRPPQPAGEVKRGLISEGYSPASLCPSYLLPMQHPPSMVGISCPGEGCLCRFCFKNHLCGLISALISGNTEPAVGLEVWEGAEGAVKGGRMPSSGIIRMPALNPLGSGILFCKSFLCIFCSVYWAGKHCLSQSLAMPFPPRLKALCLPLWAPPQPP